MECKAEGQEWLPLRLVAENSGQFSEGFSEWLRENGHVWRAFEREALKLVARGRRHYSARTIIEVLRHQSALADTSTEFKINNNCAPDLARLWRLTRPASDELFALRVQAGSGRVPA